MNGCEQGEYHCGNVLPPFAATYGLTMDNFTGPITNCNFDCTNPNIDNCDNANFYCTGNVQQCNLNAAAVQSFWGSTLHCSNITNPNAICNVDCPCCTSCDNSVMHCTNTMALCTVSGANNNKDNINIITSSPTTSPTTNQPTTFQPTYIPTMYPTQNPSDNPTINPSINPTKYPSVYPTYIPTINPTIYPSMEPTIYPSIEHIVSPTDRPTLYPTLSPFDSMVVLKTTVISTTEYNAKIKNKYIYGIKQELIFVIIVLIIIFFIIITLIICYRVRTRKKLKLQIERLNENKNNDEIFTKTETVTIGSTNDMNTNREGEIQGEKVHNGKSHIVQLDDGISNSEHDSNVEDMYSDNELVPNTKNITTRIDDSDESSVDSSIDMYQNDNTKSLKTKETKQVTLTSGVENSDSNSESVNEMYQKSTDKQTLSISPGDNV